MKWLILFAVLLSGCTTLKSKTHVWGCVGACIHAEQDIEKGEAPKDPAPADDAT